jgi:hypothetical protein
MGVRRNLPKDLDQRIWDRPIGLQATSKLRKTGRSGQFSKEQKIRNLFKCSLAGQIFDRITTVGKPDSLDSHGAQTGRSSDDSIEASMVAMGT